jgi:hypothetical protein
LIDWLIDSLVAGEKCLILYENMFTNDR